MLDTNGSSSVNKIPILISHKYVPIQFLLNNNDDDEINDVSVVHCQISSNLFFYSTFLSEILSSSHFAKVFHQTLNHAHTTSNRKRLKYLFSSIRHRQNQIYLQVHQRIYQYDEWINRLW